MKQPSGIPETRINRTAINAFDLLTIKISWRTIFFWQKMLFSTVMAKFSTSRMCKIAGENMCHLLLLLHSEYFSLPAFDTASVELYKMISSSDQIPSITPLSTYCWFGSWSRLKAGIQEWRLTYVQVVAWLCVYF